MGLFDKAKDLADEHGDKIEDLAAEHGDKVADAVDQATDLADEKTGGRFGEHLDKVDEAAEGLIDKLDGDA